MYTFCRLTTKKQRNPWHRLAKVLKNTHGKSGREREGGRERGTEREREREGEGERDISHVNIKTEKANRQGKKSLLTPQCAIC